MISKGANINTQNKEGNTPIHYAKAFKYTKLCHLLIKKGANDSIRNKKGVLPWEEFVWFISECRHN